MSTKKVKVIYRVTVSFNSSNSYVDGCFLELCRKSFYFRRLFDARCYCKLLKSDPYLNVKLFRIDANGSEEV